MIDRLLDYAADGMSLKAAKFFSGAIPLIGLSRSQFVWAENQGIFTDASPRDLNGPLDVVFLLPGEQTAGTGDRDAEGLRRWDLQKFQQVPLSTLRGRARVSSPYLVQWDVLQIDAYTRQSEWYRSWWCHLGGTTWAKVLVEGLEVRRHGKGWNVYLSDWNDIPACSRRLALACGAQFTSRYQWTVNLSVLENPFTLTLPVSTHVARTAFRLRDLPLAGNRLAALRHLVRAYSRRSGTQQSAAWVREHLRGAVHFNWLGLQGTLMPAAFDMERARSA